MQCTWCWAISGVVSFKSTPFLVLKKKIGYKIQIRKKSVVGLDSFVSQPNLLFLIETFIYIDTLTKICEIFVNLHPSDWDTSGC